MSENSDIEGLGFEETQTPKKKGQPNWMLIILFFVAAIFLCCCIVTAALIFGGAIGGVAFFGEMINGPYEIANRPMPSGTNPDNLLPPRVAGFDRVTISGEAATGLQATYVAGGLEIKAEAKVFESSNAAQNAVRNAAREFNFETGVATRLEGNLGNLAYRLVKRGNEAHLAYHRGPYFFYIRTFDSTTNFDDFMEEFPY